MTSRTMIRIALLTAAAVASGGVALATGAGDDETAPPPSGNSAVAQVEPDQAAAYAVLRRKQTAADRVPEEHRAFVESGMTDDFGASPGLSRRATTTASGNPVYVIPGRGHVCMYVIDELGGSGSCNRTSEAVKGYMVGSSSSAGRPGIVQIFGLVPDGVDEVVLRTRDGATEVTRPEGNAFAFETAGKPQQVEWGGKVVPVTHGEP